MKCSRLLNDTPYKRFDGATGKAQVGRLSGCVVRRWLIVLLGVWSLLALTSVSVRAVEARCTQDKTSGSLSCPLIGLELWEDGKRSERIFQQWNLTCSSTVQPRAVSCQLEATRIVIWPESMGGSKVAIHHYSTSDGTLRLLDASWNKGKLEFEIVYPRGDRMPVLMRFKQPLPGVEL